MLQLREVSKVYQLEAGPFTALKRTNIQINEGEFVAIMGPSGSGKSTLLQLLGGLDLSSSGEIIVDGEALNDLNEKERTIFRRTKVGFVFQNYQLLPTMTVEENVALALRANKASSSHIRQVVKELLDDVHLSDKAASYPAHLSGGQQQRVAIARALAMKPKLILADEPTGNLDQKTGREILQLLSRLNKEEKLTIVMVTHDQGAAKWADRIIVIQDGEVIRDQKQGGQS